MGPLMGWVCDINQVDGSGCVMLIRINLSCAIGGWAPLALGLFILCTSPPLVSWWPLPPLFPLLPFPLLFGPFCLKIYPFLRPFRLVSLLQEPV